MLNSKKIIKLVSSICFSLIILNNLVFSEGLFLGEKRYEIYKHNQKIGFLKVHIEKITINGESYYKTETDTISKENRWFPGEETFTKDIEYLQEDFSIAWFNSEVKQGSHNIKIEGKKEGEKLFLTATHEDNKRRVAVLPLENDSYTSGALRFVYLVRGFKEQNYSLLVLDKKDFKWRQMKVKIGRVVRRNINGEEIEVTPIKTSFGWFGSTISLVDREGNLIQSEGRGIKIASFTK